MSRDPGRKGMFRDPLLRNFAVRGRRAHTHPCTGATASLRIGGLGLVSAADHRHAAYWVSLADTVVALRGHHPGTLADLSWTLRLLCPMSHPARGRPSCVRSAWKCRPGRPSLQKRPPRQPERGGSGTPVSLLTSARSRRVSLTLILRLERCCCSSALTALPADLAWSAGLRVIRRAWSDACFLAVSKRKNTLSKRTMTLCMRARCRDRTVILHCGNAKRGPSAWTRFSWSH